MTKLLWWVSLLAALPALAGCVHSADVHCDLRAGQWSCSGDVGGQSPPLDNIVGL